jgi:hypothetical protein
MSSITNINNNSAVVNVGRTTPVSPGQQPASRSIPVVVASDQPAIPVEEQNKIQSEVALSLLGIPRAEVALGIFADVNTYDVNPTEWSSSPETYILGHGIRHLPEEAGALVEAPRGKTAVLTSKRFFRYQPGRVSAATFGVKNTVSLRAFSRNPTIRKQGIFDKYDGYYWEVKENGEGDNFTVVRRTQSLYKSPVTPFGQSGQPLRGSIVDPLNDTITKIQLDDYRLTGKSPDAPAATERLSEELDVLRANRFKIYEAAWLEAYTEFPEFKSYYDNLSSSAKIIYRDKCARDIDYWIDMFAYDIGTPRSPFDPSVVNAHTALNTRNYQTSLAVKNASAENEISLHTSLNKVLQGLDQQGSGFLLADIVSEQLVTEVAYLSSIAVDFFTNVQDGLVQAVTPTEVIEHQLLNPLNPYQYQGYTNATVWGTKSRLETLFDARKHYWSYYVSEYQRNGATITYTDPGDPVFTVEDIKYKCQRDVEYIINGYKNDLVGGGNAETKYNASMYLKNEGLSIYTQVDGSVPREIDRHEYLKDIIYSELTAYTPYFDGTAAAQRLYNGSEQGGDGLANIIIRNFKVEDTSPTFYGERGFAGNLVVMRDGLPMVHAGVFDPSLLKKQKVISAYVEELTGICKITNGVVTFGQRVKYVGEDNGAFINGNMYQVSTVLGPKGNSFIIKNESGEPLLPDTTSFDAAFVTVNPFIMPAEYDTLAEDTADPEEPGNENYQIGAQFPYAYGPIGNENLPLDYANPDLEYIGFIDTGISPQTVASIGRIREQYDTVNFTPEYINWVKNNVDPEYYGVYEYRVPRSRFSTDKLNNLETNTVYSDLTTGETGRVRPGQAVVDETGVQLTNQSVYNFDFTKVTMLKIEFSWYGAVGALFLAYVPVANGEARWVRVHHLRASNQLKIPSLGNATLPITYMVYGGGGPKEYGYEEIQQQGYSSTSHHLVKYGASYYIDGGDRGTVRLYSHNNEITEKVYGRNVYLGNVPNYSFDATLEAFYVNRSPSNEQVPNVYFMGGTVRTERKVDSDIKVIWTTPSRIYFSNEPQGSNLSISHKRASSVFGLETKADIISTQGQKVRNRVQVYPVKLSTSNLGNLTARLAINKSPVYQTFVKPNGVFELETPVIGVYEYEVSTDDLPIRIDPDSANYILDGQEIWGWFRARIENTTGSVNETVLAKLYRTGNDYRITLGKSYNGTVYLSNRAPFLCDEVFDVEGRILENSEKFITEKEGLSSILIATNTQVPIPNTGINIATVYLKPGSDQFDLSTYFDYNKEYLSYPLTNKQESLYFVVDDNSVLDINDPADNGEVSVGVTWEEQ